MLLTIKKSGLCSSYLNNLEKRDTLEAFIKPNSAFHFNAGSPEVLFIGNGTGIAPFMGFIESNKSKIKTTLFWGGKSKESFEMYDAIITPFVQKGRLHSYKLAFSQEKNPKYVQELLEENSFYVFELLKNRGCIMICGSLSMKTGVEKALEGICHRYDLPPLPRLYNKRQIVSDCY
jgi:sulfite reductase (NADPH) flavoprotein alpha-component